jgi:trans-aconitate methyltransferase
MSLSHALARQLARPHGLAGRWLGRAMDLANSKPTRLALDLLDARPGERIVDAGCGTGAALAMLNRRSPDLMLAGFDPSPAMVQTASRRLGPRAEVTIAGAADRPFQGVGFDAVLALNILYFCDPGGSMLRGLHALLRPGGRLVAYVTDAASMRDWGLVGAGLHRLWDASSLQSALGDAGFARHAVSVHHVAITRRIDGLLVRAIR